MRNTPVGRRHCRISRNTPPQIFIQTEQPSIERFSYFVRCSPCDSWVEILPGCLSVPAQTIPQLPGQPSQENAPVSKRKKSNHCFASFSFDLFVRIFAPDAQNITTVNKLVLWPDNPTPPWAAVPGEYPRAQNKSKSWFFKLFFCFFKVFGSGCSENHNCQ